MARRTLQRGMHPEDIKAAVRKAGLTLTDLALRHGLPENACRNALRRPNFAGEQAILALLGLSPSRVWPGRYFADGTSKIRRRSLQSKGRRPAGHRQMQEAA